jgi:hypothetical protein
MKFSIRDLLWLTLVAAFAVAWWVDRSHLQSKLETIEARMRAEEDLARASSSTAIARAKFEAALAEAERVGAQAIADMEKVQSKAKQAAEKAMAEFEAGLPRGVQGAAQFQDLHSDEGPVQGYKPLGPPPKSSRP